MEQDVNDRKPNFHGTAVVVDGVGVFIQGASGAGKTSIALGLLDVCAARNLDARLISDDQVYLTSSGSGLIASAPKAIEGMAELSGLGIIELPANRIMQSHKISLVATLEDDAAVERMAYPDTIMLADHKLPLCRLPIRHEAQAIRILLASIENLPRE